MKAFMRTKRIILFLIISSILTGFVSSSLMTVKYTPASHPQGFDAFWSINFIIIYEYDEKTDEEITDLLVHEYTHQLCWELFGIYPKNIYDHSERCFI